VVDPIGPLLSSDPTFFVAREVSSERIVVIMRIDKMSVRSLLRCAGLAVVAVPSFIVGASVPAKAVITYAGSSCQPTAVDHNISSPTWNIRGADNSTVAGFNGKVTCFGTAYDVTGTFISTVSGDTTGASGAFSMVFSIGVGANWQDVNQYVATCFIPYKQGNSISEVRVVTLA
jgi:hypothetical protein